ncbi:D-alanyl-D-alanine carboxypeptidase [Eubacteriales bacterium OttesenSCG-928-N13]|nr:D-alanyl-D-alanine carboxypeptidase [Eubacteriales bacterium OttesenSCG-928-N13]
MRTKRCALMKGFLVLLAFMLIVPTALANETLPSPLEEGQPIPIAAKSALLMEPVSGQVIFAMNADEPRPIASVTKIMGILLACEAVEQERVSLTDEITISKAAAGMGGSQVLLDVGEVQPLSVLIKSMVVGSANDATVAVGEHLFGSEQLFVERMNKRAKELGMQNTNFVNSTGLPAEGAYSTARDVAIMSMELIKHDLFFEDSHIWMDEVQHPDGRVTQLTNTNRLIRTYEGADGIKTGSTNQAGYCMSASAKRGDMRLIAVVLGANSGKERFSIASQILDYGFANYRSFRVAEKGAKVRGQLPVTGGAKQSVQLLLGGDLSLLIQKGDEQEIQLTPDLPSSMHAPIAEGEQVGSVLVTRGGRSVGKIPVVAAEGVERQNYGTGWERVLREWFYLK